MAHTSTAVFRTQRQHFSIPSAFIVSLLPQRSLQACLVGLHLDERVTPGGVHLLQQQIAGLLELGGACTAREARSELQRSVGLARWQDMRGRRPSGRRTECCQLRLVEPTETTE